MTKLGSPQRLPHHLSHTSHKQTTVQLEPRFKTPLEIKYVKVLPNLDNRHSVIIKRNRACRTPESNRTEVQRKHRPLHVNVTMSSKDSLDGLETCVHLHGLIQQSKYLCVAWASNLCVFHDLCALEVHPCIQWHLSEAYRTFLQFTPAPTGPMCVF